MLTTDTAKLPRTGGAPAGRGPLVVAAAVSTGVGLVLVVAGALVEGSAASYGALLGTAIAVVVFSFGAFTVDAVARLLPVASLMVALLTYTLQVVLMALVFVGLSGSGLLDDTISRPWLGGAIIAGALVWSAVQIRATTTARIPVYELPVERTPEHPSDAVTEGARPAAEGGAG
jgi:ATP synthase protein I